MSVNKGIALAAVGLLALTVGAGGVAAKPGKSQGKQIGKLSAKRCSAEKKTLGKDAFDELYGKPSMPNCLGVKRSEAAPALKGASKACKAERSDPTFADTHGGMTFDQHYGTNKNLKNAFGKCVSGKSKA